MNIFAIRSGADGSLAYWLVSGGTLFVLLLINYLKKK